MVLPMRRAWRFVAGRVTARRRAGEWQSFLVELYSCLFKIEKKILSVHGNRVEGNI